MISRFSLAFRAFGATRLANAVNYRYCLDIGLVFAILRRHTRITGLRWESATQRYPRLAVHQIHSACSGLVHRMKNWIIQDLYTSGVTYAVRN